MSHPLVPRMIENAKRWELVMLKAYQDTDKSWHVGLGHGNAAGIFPHVDEFTVLKDEAEAMKIWEDDLQYLVPILEKMIKVPVNDNQFCALWDVAYNRGPGTLRTSAVIHHLNNIDDPHHMDKVPLAFIVHEEGFTPLNVAADRVTGVPRVYTGLTNRRIDNASLFQLPI